MDAKDLADLSRHFYNKGIGEIHMKGFTEEQENTEMKKTFEEISAMGYAHIHT